MSDCRFGVSPVNYPDPDPDPDLKDNVKIQLSQISDFASKNSLRSATTEFI